jgi:xanthosine utilization system XapX-like protein
MGKFSRSWELVKQSFAILRSDKQLMLFPILSAASCILVTALIATGGVIAMLPSMAEARALGPRWQPNHSPIFLVALFLIYIANYFVMVFFNVALVGVANSRLMGGKWTFRDGIELAWARKGTIFQWALLAATVGMILRSLEERMGLLGRIIMRFVGIAWALACYFVVPVLAFEDLTPIDAVKRSAKLFHDTWGEKVVGGFSLGLVFFLLALPAFAIWIAAIVLGGIYGMFIGMAFLILYLLLLSVTSSAVQGIFNAALYRYACFKQVPPAFSKELITAAWAPKS